jgi:hypothetical protein
MSVTIHEKQLIEREIEGKIGEIDSDTGELVKLGCKPYVRPYWARVRKQKFNTQPTMTDNAHKDLTDINNVVKRYLRTGALPATPNKQEMYEDITHMQGEFTEVINRGKELMEKAEKAKAFFDTKDKEIKAKASKENFDKAVDEEIKKRSSEASKREEKKPEK